MGQILNLPNHHQPLQQRADGGVGGDGNGFSGQQVVFVVPGNIHLTVNQMSMMISSGQQPGVPFCLSNDGVQRPQGARARVQYAENTCTLHRSSLKLWDEGDGVFTISFCYDASCAATLMVYIGTKDRTNADLIKIEEAVVTWGPLILPAGLNQAWSSRNASLFIKENQLPGRSRSSLGNDVYDVIISLSPSLSPDYSDDHLPSSTTHNNSNSNSNSSGSNSSSNNGSWFDSKGINSNSSKGNASSSSSSRSSSSSNIVSDNDTDKNRHIDNVVKGGGRIIDIGNVHNSNYSNSNTNSSSSSSGFGLGLGLGLGLGTAASPVIPHTASSSSVRGGGGGGGGSGFTLLSLSELALAAENTLGILISSPPPSSSSSSSSSRPTSPSDVRFSHSSLSHNSHNNNSKTRNHVRCEVSYGRITTAGQTATGAVKKDDGPFWTSSLNGWTAGTIPMKCVMQRVQMRGGVFLTQDLYGMDRSQNNNSNTTSSSSSNKNTMTSSSKDNDDDDALGVDGGDDKGGGGGMNLDADADECVICLTDPRVVAVYPCRHMCMCASCAEALPSQANKCPMCRRAAVMLLQIQSPSSSSPTNVDLD